MKILNDNVYRVRWYGTANGPKKTTMFVVAKTADRASVEAAKWSTFEPDEITRLGGDVIIAKESQ